MDSNGSKNSQNGKDWANYQFQDYQTRSKVTCEYSKNKKKNHCETKISARSCRKVPLLTEMACATKEHNERPKDERRNVLRTDESKIVLFGSGGHRHFVRWSPPKHWIQDTVDWRQWSVVEQASWYGMFVILWCRANISHTRDHGWVWKHQNTSSGLMTKRKCPWNGCLNKTTTPNTPVSSTILVPDQPD